MFTSFFKIDNESIMDCTGMHLEFAVRENITGNEKAAVTRGISGKMGCPGLEPGTY